MADPFSERCNSSIDTLWKPLTESWRYTSRREQQLMNVNERIKEIKYFFTDSVPRKNNLAKKIKLHTPNAQCQKICEFVPYKVDREMV